MAIVEDKDGLREIKSVSVKGSSYGIGSPTNVEAAGLTVASRSFTNYSTTTEVFDSDNTTAATNAVEITNIYALLLSAGVVQSITYNGITTTTL